MKTLKDGLNKFGVAIAAVMAIAWLSLVGYAIAKEHDVEVIISKADCCSIAIDNTDKIITYTTIEFEEDESFSDEQDLEIKVNNMIEYCYAHHGTDDSGNLIQE